MIARALLLIFLFQSLPSVEDSTTGGVEPFTLRETIPLKEGHTINFEKLPVEEYIRLVAKLANRNFVYTEPLNFSVTVIAEEPESIETIMATLMQVLRINGYAMLEQGDNIYIYKSSDAPQSSEVLFGLESNQKSGLEAAILTAVIRLQGLSPEHAEEIVRPMLSPNARLKASKETQHLIITDISANIKKVQEVIQYLDLPALSGAEMDHYLVKYSNMHSLIEMAKKLLIPYVAPQKPPTFIPFPRAEKIFLIGNKAAIQKAKKILRTLDVKEVGAAEGQGEDLALREGFEGTKFHTYHLQYHKGDEIKKALVGIAENLQQSELADQELMTIARSAQWLQTSNSLLFVGSFHAIRKVTELLKHLDVPKKQVFLEVLMIKTTVGNSLKFEVNWGLNNKPNAPENENSNMYFSPFKINIIGKVLRRGDRSFLTLDSLLEYVEQEDTSEVVINQKLMVSNMEEGYFGDTHSSDRTEESLESTTSGTDLKKIMKKVGRFETGATLKIVPIIGDGNIMTLSIDQNMTTRLNTENNDTTSTQTRTKVHVPDGYFLVLGGTGSDINMKTRKSMPCLGAIPLLGDKLGDKKQSQEKKSILIFIRPRIVETPEDGQLITQEQKNLAIKLSDKKKDASQSELESTLQFYNMEFKPRKELYENR